MGFSVEQARHILAQALESAQSLAHQLEAAAPSVLATAHVAEGVGAMLRALPNADARKALGELRAFIDQGAALAHQLEGFTRKQDEIMKSIADAMDVVRAYADNFLPPVEQLQNAVPFDGTSIIMPTAADAMRAVGQMHEAGAEASKLLAESVADTTLAAAGKTLLTLVKPS